MYTPDSNPNPTVDHLLVRVERQRNRAERWTKKYEDLQQENRDLQKLICEYESLIENRKRDRDQELKSLKDEHNAAIDIKNSCIRSLSDEKTKLQNSVFRLEYKYDSKEEVIAIGQREIDRRKNERRKKLIQKLRSEPYIDENGDFVPWVRKAIKREFSVDNHVPVYLVTGREVEKLGEPGYHTTPSGGTIIRYPNAYRWRTVYHTSTERLEVGRGWLTRNKKKLAKKEAEFRIK